MIASGLGQTLNPVSAVHNDIEIVPFPPGWMLLAAHGAKATLLGEAATEFEARDLARSIKESWSAKGGSVSGSLKEKASVAPGATSIWPGPISCKQTRRSENVGVVRRFSGNSLRKISKDPILYSAISGRESFCWALSTILSISIAVG
jgi:hypothetical protein